MVTRVHICSKCAHESTCERSHGNRKTCDYFAAKPGKPFGPKPQGMSIGGEMVRMMIAQYEKSMH